MCKKEMIYEYTGKYEILSIDDLDKKVKEILDDDNEVIYRI